MIKLKEIDISMSMENIVGKSLEELSRGSQILDTPYDSTTVYELGSMIRDEMRIPINVSITTSNSSGTVLDNGESSIASSLQVTIKSALIRKFLSGKGITQPDFVAMVGDIIKSGMLFSVKDVTIDRYNASSLYEDALTISIDYAYTKVTDFDGGKDIAKKDHTTLSGLADQVENLSKLVKNMDTNFGTEVTNIKAQLESSHADVPSDSTNGVFTDEGESRKDSEDTSTEGSSNGTTTDTTTDSTTDTTTGATSEATPSQSGDTSAS